MFTDIDGWASILWIVLLATAIWGLRSDPRNRAHTRILLGTAPAILVFMAVYANARQDDAWCLGWAVAVSDSAILTADRVGINPQRSQAGSRRLWDCRTTATVCAGAML